jgi:hypothetical protein
MQVWNTPTPTGRPTSCKPWTGSGPSSRPPDRLTEGQADICQIAGLDESDRSPTSPQRPLTRSGVTRSLTVKSWPATRPRLSLDLLQRRLASRPSGVPALARQHPASFVAFDILSRDGLDLRPRPWTQHRAALEELSRGWKPPLQLSPFTRERSEAERWFIDYQPLGIDGLVVKGAATPYLPGRRAGSR